MTHREIDIFGDGSTMVTEIIFESNTQKQMFLAIFRPEFREDRKNPLKIWLD